MLGGVATLAAYGLARRTQRPAWIRAGAVLALAIGLYPSWLVYQRLTAVYGLDSAALLGGLGATVIVIGWGAGRFLGAVWRQTDVGP